MEKLGVQRLSLSGFFCFCFSLFFGFFCFQRFTLVCFQLVRHWEFESKWDYKLDSCVQQKLGVSETFSVFFCFRFSLFFRFFLFSNFSLWCVSACETFGCYKTREIRNLSQSFSTKLSVWETLFGANSVWFRFSLFFRFFFQKNIFGVFSGCQLRFFLFQGRCTNSDLLLFCSLLLVFSFLKVPGQLADQLSVRVWSFKLISLKLRYFRISQSIFPLQLFIYDSGEVRFYLPNLALSKGIWSLKLDFFHSRLLPCFAFDNSISTSRLWFGESATFVAQPYYFQVDRDCPAILREVVGTQMWVVPVLNCCGLSEPNCRG